MVTRHASSLDTVHLSTMCHLIPLVAVVRVHDTSLVVVLMAPRDSGAWTHTQHLWHTVGTSILYGM